MGVAEAVAVAGNPELMARLYWMHVADGERCCPWVAVQRLMAWIAAWPSQGIMSSTNTTGS